MRRSLSIRVNGNVPFNLSFKAVSHCPNVDPQWTHEYIPSAAPSGIFGMPKLLRCLLKLMQTQEKHNQVQMMAYDALMNVPMFFQCSYDHFRTLGECEACLTMCQFRDSVIHRLQTLAHLHDGAIM